MEVDRENIADILDIFRSGAAMWFSKPFFCAINRAALEMTGFSQEDFRNNESLWLMRVHPCDVRSVKAARRQLRTEMREVICHYRFVPNGETQEIWIRDISCPIEGSRGGFGGIFSVYGKVSDPLTAKRELENHGADLRKVVGGVAHNIRSSLQELSGNLELAELEGSTPERLRRAANKTLEVNQLVGELEEYLCPPEAHFARGSAVVLLKSVLRSVENRLRARGITLAVEHQESLPPLEIDPRQISQTIDRLLSFSAAMLPQGGTLKVKARPCSWRGMEYVQVELTCCSPSYLPLHERDVFEPFIQVGEYRTSLSLALAREAMDRNFGRISFRRKGAREARFTLLLKVFSGS